MRKLLFLGMSIFYMLASAFCNYSPIVSQYLNTEENYVELEAKISSVQYNEEGYSYIYINLVEFSRYVGFTGVLPEDDPNSELLDSTVIEIRVVNDSAKLLNDRGFFDEIDQGDVINIRTTCWIYELENRHYIAEIVYNDECYLSFEEGFENISKATLSFKE